MKNTKEKLNFLKWQLLARAPKGSIYERVKESLINNNISENDPFYYIYWLDINRSLLKKYLLGTFGTANDDYNLFIEWMNKNYLNEDFYEIAVDNSTIKMPIPFEKDYKCFKAEFLDIIMPYIVKGRNMVHPFLEGPYEYNDVVVNNGGVVFDCGANFGMFSSLASSRDCEVYAFEPTPCLIDDYLNKLKQLNPNVNIVNKAVSDRNGSALFKVDENKNSCNSLNQINNNSQKDFNLVSVDTITIDEFVSQQNLSRVDFIKSDIEGAERLMLQGAKETLREFAPNLAICYYHCWDDLKVLTDLILEANPNYEIETGWKKIYAKVQKK